MPTADVPSIGVDAANDAGPRSPTSINVYGSVFPPGTAVNVTITFDAGTRKGTTLVGADGSFDWAVMVRPLLKRNTRVFAVVHGSDGIVVKGDDVVFMKGDVP